MQNEKGFILYEHLLTLSIVLSLLPLIVFIFQVIQEDPTLDDIAVEHFFIFIRNDIWYSSNYEVQNNKLYITNKDNEVAIIELMNDRIRRRLNGGNEFYLYDVTKMDVEMLPYGLKINILTKGTNHYEKVIPFPVR